MRAALMAAGALCALLFSGCARTPMTTLDGLVQSSLTGEPVAGASIVLVHPDDITGQPIECGRATTDAAGRFAVAFPASGHPSSRAWGTTLRIEARSFAPFTEEKPLSLASPGTRLEEDGTKVYLLAPDEGGN